MSVTFGIIQTALYVDFAWVYWTRQRVKLRNGGVVDSEDLRKSFLVGRVLGNENIVSQEDDDEETPALHNRRDEERQQSANAPRKWGARGISVSADEGVHSTHADTAAANSGELADPDAFEDDLDDDADGLPPATKAANGAARDVGNGSEWRDGR